MRGYNKLYHRLRIRNSYCADPFVHALSRCYFSAQPFFATKERPAFLWNAGLSDFCDYSNILWRQYLVSGIGSRPKYLPSVKSGKATGAPPIAMDASLSAVTAI